MGVPPCGLARVAQGDTVSRSPYLSLCLSLSIQPLPSTKSVPLQFDSLFTSLPILLALSVFNSLSLFLFIFLSLSLSLSISLSPISLSLYHSISLSPSLSLYISPHFIAHDSCGLCGFGFLASSRSTSHHAIVMPNWPRDKNMCLVIVISNWLECFVTSS